jgi:hypothetical protein
MTEEPHSTKIENLTNGKFTIIAKVTSENQGSDGSTFLQRGIMGDDTGSIDFEIYRNAQLDSLENGSVYEFKNIFAFDNTGFLTLRPNKRKDGSSLTKIDGDLEEVELPLGSVVITK